MISKAKRGVTQTKEYHAWEGMKARCYNKNDASFCYYGGRGILVCDRWLHSFDTFILDMGLAPSKKHSIDREDCNGHYDPNNCRWATHSEQMRNRRISKMITIDGQTKSASAWAEVSGIDANTALERLKRGWCEKSAFFDPLVVENDYSTVEINGQIDHLINWSKKYNKPYEAVKQRIRRGWSFEDAIKKPLRSINQ